VTPALPKQQPVASNHAQIDTG